MLTILKQVGQLFLTPRYSFILGLVLCLITATGYNFYLRSENKTLSQRVSNFSAMIDYQNEMITQYKERQLQIQMEFTQYEKEQDAKRKKALSELEGLSVVVPPDCQGAMHKLGEQGSILNALY